MSTGKITAKALIDRAAKAGLEVEGTILTTFERDRDRITVQANGSTFYSRTSTPFSFTTVSPTEAAKILKV